jgi:hypothetical protein
VFGAAFGLLLGSLFVAHLVRSLRTERGSETIPALVAFLGLSAVSVLYVLGSLPAHTGRLKYWMAFTPVLAVALARAVSSVVNRPGRVRWLQGALLAALLGQAAQAALATWLDVTRSRADTPAMLSKGAPILIDSAKRGVVPPILWRVPPRTFVYAADQGELSMGLPAIADSVRELVYVSDLRYANSTAGRGRVLRELRERGFAGVSIPGGVHGAGELYWLSR